MTSIWDDIRSQFDRGGLLVNRLILLNVFVFVLLALFKLGCFFAGAMPFYEASLHWVALPDDFTRFITRPWTLVTYMFVHEEVFHILSNMLFLYYFGSLIEEYLGKRRLLSLYLTGGLFGGVVYLVMYNLIPVFASSNVILYGASGAVYACVVGAATLLPNYTFNIILLGPIRIVFIALFYVIISIVSLPNGNAGGNLAHLGGALLGFLFIRFLRQGTDIGKPVLIVTDFFERLFKPKEKIRVTSRNYQPTAARTTISSTKIGGSTTKVAFSDGRPSQEEIDAILDKISRSGYDALSKEEKQKLFKASQD